MFRCTVIILRSEEMSGDIFPLERSCVAGWSQTVVISSPEGCDSANEIIMCFYILV